MQALVMLLLAPLFVLVPSRADAQEAGSSRIVDVPQGFGIPVEQDDGFAFGTRVSSASFAATVLLQSCDETDRGWTRGGQHAQDEFNISLSLLSPGMRYEVELCTTYLYTLVPRYVLPPCYSDPVDPAILICPPGYYVYDSVRSGETVDATLLQTNVPAPGVEGWIEEASKAALDSVGDQLDDVYWNSSPHYERRQIVGLNTFFATSAQDVVNPQLTRGEFLPTPVITGFGGPTDVETGEPEIFVAIFVGLPRATFKFSDDVVIDCDNPGELWSEGVVQTPEDPTADGLCVRSWRDSSVADGSGVDTIELQEVNLLYPWELDDATNAEEVIGYFPDFPTSGEFASEKAGGQRDFVIGEVQTYGVDGDGNLTPDDVPVDSGWVGPRNRTCDTVASIPVVGWFAGKVCEAIAGLINIYATGFQLIWDGATYVVTVVKVIASGAWDLIKGCIAAGSDALADLGETAGAVIDFVQDPAGQVNEVIQTVSMIEEQLANPDTRWEFVQQVLMDLVGEFLDLDLIAEQDENGVWQLKEDPQWAQWVGKVACGVLIAYVTAGVTKALKASKFGIRIQRWLDGGLPDAVPCVLTAIGRGAEYLAAVNDFVEIANNAAGQNETNSFPGGTLVLMADGSYEPIEHVQPGDFVLSFDFDASIWEPQVVVDQWSAIDDGQIATVTLDDGSQVAATDGHLFWVDSIAAWVELEDIHVGDELLTPSGVAVVQQVTEAPASATVVYELTVAENHNFAVNTGTTDVLVHNRCRNNGGGDGGDGDGDSDFTQNEETGVVTYESEYGDIEGVALDGNRQPTVIKTGDFELILMEDGSLTVIDGNGNIIPGGVLNPDGSVSVTRPDGSRFVIDSDGDSIDLPPDSPIQCNSFPAGTQVRLASGDYKNIEDIRPGDHVLSYDFAIGGWVDSQVLAQWSAIDDGIIGTITLDDGAQVSATDHHDFWVESSQEWEPLDELEFGDELLSPQGLVTVESVSLDPDDESVVWELTVQNTHNFTVLVGDHDVLVHNCDIEYHEDGSRTVTGEDVHGNGLERNTDADGNTTTTVTFDGDGAGQSLTVHPDGTATFVDSDGVARDANRTVRADGTVGPLMTVGPPREAVRYDGQTRTPPTPSHDRSSVDPATGIVTYERDLVDADGQTYTATQQYDSDGFPIFDGPKVTIEIGAADPKTGTPTASGNDTADFRAANDALRTEYQALDGDSAAQSAFLDQFDEGPLRDGVEQIVTTEGSPFPNGDSPSNLTWHHHQDTGVMQLTPSCIHNCTTADGWSHLGGGSIWGGR